MDEKKPQPAWRNRDGRQQDSRDHRGWNRGQQRDNRGRRPGLPPLQEQKAPVVGPLEVEVFNGNVDQALRVLKNKISKDGILAELKRHRHAEKPSEAKRNKHREALKRMRKSKGKRRAGGWRPRNATTEPGTENRNASPNPQEKENGR